MKRIAIIRPFFNGLFLSYFQLFLNSCRNNPDFDWIIFTDNEESYDYPPNVHKIKMTFLEAKELISRKFDFSVALSNPNKLHDYKAAYGYIFSDYLKKYDFFGYTDYDVIYGQLKHFITEEMLERYDKLYIHGHFSLCRNTPEIVTLFKKEIQGRLLYKEVLKSPDNCNFDEDWNGNLNVNDIFRENGRPLYENPDNESKIADIYTKSSDFRVVYQETGTFRDIVEKKEKSLFAYVDGRLVRYTMCHGQLKETEYLYIHLQKREMKLQGNVLNSRNYTIIPNAFVPLESKITSDNFKDQRIKYFNLHYFKLRYHNLKIKIRHLGKGGKSRDAKKRGEK